MSSKQMKTIWKTQKEEDFGLDKEDKVYKEDGERYWLTSSSYGKLISTNQSAFLSNVNNG